MMSTDYSRKAIRTGSAYLPLHGGSAPRWLFKRMVSLSKAICEVLVFEYGRKELLRRLSDPWWFQAFSCVLGFDWHSSGTTTVTCGALKEALRDAEIGIRLAGGKGSTSRKTPSQIVEMGTELSLSTASIETLQRASRLSAKVDNAALQDGYQLYHHVLIFTEEGDWAVIQQGMNPTAQYARRYHWLSENLQSFVDEPHTSIVGEKRHDVVLDMTAGKSADARAGTVSLFNEKPEWLQRQFKRIKMPFQATLYDLGRVKLPPELCMPKRINWDAVRAAYEFSPKGYEEVLEIRGMGPGTVRALALISSLVYGSKISWEDPLKYTFTVGGKDGVPYPVNRKVMDRAIEVLQKGIKEAKIGRKEQLRALRRLEEFVPEGKMFI